MKQVLALTVGLFIAVLSSSAVALEAKTFYLGLEVGNSETVVGARFQRAGSDGRAQNLSQSESEAPVYTFSTGYNFSKRFSMELQFANFASDDILQRQVNIKPSSTGLFLGVGGGKDVFFQVLLGLGQTSIDVESKSGVSQSESKTSYSYGLRVGKKVGPGDITVLYMRYPDVIFDRNAFAADTAVGNDGNAGNLGGVRFNRRLTVESLSVGYRFNF